MKTGGKYIYKLGVGKDVLNNRAKKERIDVSIMPYLRTNALLKTKLKN